jgi:hypothetical protein
MPNPSRAQRHNSPTNTRTKAPSVNMDLQNPRERLRVNRTQQSQVYQRALIAREYPWQPSDQHGIDTQISFQKTQEFRQNTKNRPRRGEVKCSRVFNPTFEQVQPALAISKHEASCPKMKTDRGGGRSVFDVFSTLKRRSARFDEARTREHVHEHQTINSKRNLSARINVASVNPRLTRSPSAMQRRKPSTAEEPD